MKIRKKTKYHQNKSTKSTEQLEKEREKARIRKALLREKQKETLSRQKLQCLKIKERNRKRKECSGENFSSPPSVMHTPLSTERVQKHRENKKLIVDINFKTSHERKSNYLSKKLRNAVAMASPKSKANSISKLVTSLSPKTKDAIMSNLKETENPILMQVFDELKNKRDRLSNYPRKLIMKSLPTAVKNKGIRAHLRRKIHSESTAGILKHYKTVRKTKKVDTNVHGTIISFYEKNVSRVLPFKNMTKVVKDQLSSKKRALVRVMELTAKDAFDLFC